MKGLRKRVIHPFMNKPLSELRGRKVLKRFWVNAVSCRSVEKLEGGYIRKTYDLNRTMHQERYTRELKVMARLADCPFVPKIVAVDTSDPKRPQIYMTDCGKSVANHTIFREQRRYAKKIPKLMKRLEDEYGLVYLEHGKQTYKLPLRNATVLDGRLHIIDFNGDHWKFIRSPLPGPAPPPPPPPLSTSVVQGPIVHVVAEKPKEKTPPPLVPVAIAAERARAQRSNPPSQHSIPPLQMASASATGTVARVHKVKESDGKSTWFVDREQPPSSSGQPGPKVALMLVSG